jgi:hypothetical protein
MAWGSLKFAICGLIYQAPFVPGAASSGGFMLCYQVLVQFAFNRHKPVLVSTHIKRVHVEPFLVETCLPFGSVLKHRRFFSTKQEAVRYVSHLQTVYKGRTITNPPHQGGQLLLF